VTDEELLGRVRAVVGGAQAALEQARRRIDDLNVYPVPDGDTGTNLSSSLGAVVQALETATPMSAATLAGTVERAALMGGRGNSGIILSQILRGLCRSLGGGAERAAVAPLETSTLALALRGAADAAYRAVSRPVEGTMLTVVRELAEEAEAAAGAGVALHQALDRVLRRGADAVRRTPELLETLRLAGVVDAGGAGLLEIARGAVAGLRDQEPSASTLPALVGDGPRTTATGHDGESVYRYCTSFVVTGGAVEPRALERALEPLGDSLIVVGDADATKVHVHTDDPGRALSLATAMGVIGAVDIADMRSQIAERDARLLEGGPPAPAGRPVLRLVGAEHHVCDVVCVVAGDGNADLAAGLGARGVVRGGQTMNPSTAEILAAVEACAADGVVVLPNNRNVVLAAHAAARAASVPTSVVETTSIPEGLAALVPYDAAASLETNVAAMSAAAGAVVTGEVTRAVRDATVDGLTVREGAFIGLVGGRAVAADPAVAPVVAEVADRLLRDGRSLLTVLTGFDVDSAVTAAVEALGAAHPEAEIDVQAGGQPHYPLLLAAE
jgi:hypothetical protein